ncbi:MAG: diadenylate cyclase CdaA [Eubacteriales bacterium]
MIKDYISDLRINFITQITSMRIMDIIDILIVSVVVYYLIKFIRERRAGKLAAGVVILMVFEAAGQILDFMALQFLMQNVFQVGIIALIVVFSPELRSALEKMGGLSLRNLRSITEQKDIQAITSMINDLCEALFDLSKDKTGALVVIEISTKLGDVIKSGTLLNAEMSPFLIKNIFFNKAPLHDGAVIIRDTRIYAAGCFLPLSENTDIIKDLGTRHRAAIGMSENSDAIILVVSEETGIISMAHEGKLRRSYDYMSLRRELLGMLINDANLGTTVRRVFSKKDSFKSGKGRDAE